MSPVTGADLRLVSTVESLTGFRFSESQRTLLLQCFAIHRAPVLPPYPRPQ